MRRVWNLDFTSSTRGSSRLHKFKMAGLRRSETMFRWPDGRQKELGGIFGTIFFFMATHIDLGSREQISVKVYIEQRKNGNVPVSFKMKKTKLHHVASFHQGLLAPSCHLGFADLHDREDPGDEAGGWRLGVTLWNSLAILVGYAIRGTRTTRPHEHSSFFKRSECEVLAGRYNRSVYRVRNVQWLL